MITRARLFSAAPLAIVAGLGALALWGLAGFPSPGEMPAIRAAVAERAAAGKAPSVEQAVGLTLWWASLWGFVVAVILGVGLRWWSPRGGVVLEKPTSLARWVPVVLLAAVALACVPRVPRLAHSFWNDEETTMQDYAWGEWREAKDGKWKFKPVPWEDTLFYNRGGSNHVLNSILTRATLQAADHLNGPEKGRFSEVAARALPFLASLGTVFLLGWLGARAGWPLAGCLAAVFLALHPWHVRYSVEIRGYSVMLLAILGALGCLHAALASGRRRWWAGFAVCEAAFLLCFAGSLYMAVAVNTAAVVLIVLANVERAERWRAFRSLAAWNFLATVPVVFFMLPSLPQFAYYLEHGKRMISFTPGWGWERDYLSHLLAGIPQTPEPAGGSLGLSLPQTGPTGRWLLWLGPVAALAGLARMVSRGGFGRAGLMAASLLAAPVLSYLHNKTADNPTMPWYLLFSVLTLCLGWGALVGPGRPDFKKPAAWAGAVLLSVLLATWIPVIVTTNRAMATVPRQPIREVASLMRGTAPTYGETGDTAALTATFGTSAKRLASYDPRVVVVDSLDELAALQEKAAALRVPLWVAHCGRRLALTSPDREADDDLVRALEGGSPGFVKVADIQGMEEFFSYHVYRLEPPAK